MFWYKDEDALKLSEAENQVQLSHWLKPLGDLVLQKL